MEKRSSMWMIRRAVLVWAVVVSNFIQSQVVINEINADNPGGLDNQEFVELYTNPFQDLSGWVMVFYDGATLESYGAYDLTGYFADSLGFFVVGSSLIPSAQITIPNSFIQNGCDAVAIHQGSVADFPNGTLVSSSGLVDALVYVTDDVVINALITGLDLNVINPLYQPANETNQLSGSDVSISRIPDGGLAFDVASMMLQGVTPGWYNDAPCEAGFITGANDLNTYYIRKDSIPDSLHWDLTVDQPSDSVLFALVSDSGLFISWVNDGFDYDTLPIGIYHILGISFTGALNDSIVGLPFSSIYSSTCYDWTDNQMTLEILTHPTIFINELNVDNPNGADDDEFVELITAPNASLDNVVVVLYDGASAAVYAVFDLSGEVADSNGFYVIGNINVAQSDWIIDNGTIQNGCDAVALYRGHGTDFLIGDNAQPNFLLDTWVYVTGDAPTPNLINALNLYQLYPGYMPFDETVQTSGWDKSQSRVPDGGPAFENQNVVLQEMTPGDFNVVVFGCQDSTACDFNPNANYPSGICSQPQDPCDDGNASTINDVYDANCVCAGTLVGVEENEWVSSLRVYPNPTKDVLNIRWTGFKNEVLQVQVFNIAGQKVDQFQWVSSAGENQHQITTTQWKSGFYILEWQVGDSVSRAHVIKE